MIDAWLDLVAGGDMAPTASLVAEQAGVSLRSVFRYFEDLDDLWETAVHRFVERHPDLYAPPAPAADTAGRVEAIVDARLALFCQIAPLTRALLARATLSADVDLLVRERRDARTSAILDYFAADLAAITDPARQRAASYGIVAMLGYENLDLLQDKYGLTLTEIHNIVTHNLTALLHPDR